MRNRSAEYLYGKVTCSGYEQAIPSRDVDENDVYRVSKNNNSIGLRFKMAVSPSGPATAIS